MLDRINNSQLIWIIVGILLLIIALGTGYLWLNSANEKPASEQVVATPPKTEKAPVAKPLVESAETTAASEVDSNALVKETILTEQVPENATLAKEEISKLDDIQKQLNELDAALKSQHADADKIIQLKEEQVKLLEQKLAAQASS